MSGTSITSAGITAATSPERVYITTGSLTAFEPGTVVLHVVLKSMQIVSIVRISIRGMQGRSTVDVNLDNNDYNVI